MVGPPLGFQAKRPTYSGKAGVLLAHRLPYRPRPVMQSYQVYTPELAGVIAAFLRSERAPAACWIKPFSDFGFQSSFGFRLSRLRI